MTLVNVLVFFQKSEHAMRQVLAYVCSNTSQKEVLEHVF
jgi:hypothetical protein